MTLRICVALVVCLSVFFPEVDPSPLPPPIPPPPPPLLSPLDAEAIFLALERFLRTAKHIINAALSIAEAVSEVDIAAADAVIHVAAHGIAAAANATAVAAKECSRTASAELQGALQQFYEAVEKCLAKDVDQLRTAFVTLEKDTSNAQAVLASAEGQVLSCLTSGKNYVGVVTCIDQALPNTVADVSGALTKFHLSLARVLLLSSVFPGRSKICENEASAGTSSAIAAVKDDIEACIATAAPQAV